MSAHIFIDAENIKPEVGFKTIEKFSNEFSVEQVEIIGNETTLSNKYLEAGYNIKNSYFGKNSADTWLCTEIAKTIFEKPEVDTIIIVSSDRDFLAAIKLATDQKRKVIFVSDGNGHKNLKAMFYDLRINPDFVELVDFKTEFGIFQPKNFQPKKPIYIISPETFSSQNISADKVKKRLKKYLPPHLKAFYYKNEHKFKFTTLTQGKRTVEVPFFSGINISTFTNILIALKIIPNGKSIPSIIEENQLTLYDNKIYLDAPENIEFESFETENAETENVDAENIEVETPVPDKKSFDEVINYFVEHATETKNIFIKYYGRLYEVPFINGISLEMFSELLKGYEITSDAAEIKKIIAESFLDLRDDKIYFHNEDEISAELREYLKKIPPETLNVMMKNENKLKIVSIAHNAQVNKVPFVEGMPLSAFVYMLRQMNIFDKNSDSVEILKGNDFKIRDNFIYLHNVENAEQKLKGYLKKLPSDALKFMLSREDELKTVSIAHNNAVHKVPFVEGMDYPMFVHMLRHLQIIGKNCQSLKILTANGFTVRNNLIFKNK